MLYEMKKSFAISDIEIYRSVLGEKALIEEWTANCIREICLSCLYTGLYIEGLERGDIYIEFDLRKKCRQYTVSLSLFVRRVTVPILPRDIDYYAQRAAESIAYMISSRKPDVISEGGIKMLEELSASSNAITESQKKPKQYKITQRPKSCSNTSC